MKPVEKENGGDEQKNRRDEIREKVANKVASFEVGDLILFSIYDETGCNEHTGDPVEIEMSGTIISIKGNWATVENKNGTFHTWLAIARKVGEL